MMRPRMMMKRFGWLVLAGAALAGCNKGPQGGTEVVSNPTVTTPEVTTPQTGGSPTVPDASANPSTPPTTAPKAGGTSVEPDPLGDVKVPPFDIKVSDPTWSRPTGTAKEPKGLTASEVAAKMDQSFAGLKNAWVQTQVSYTVPSIGKLTGKAEAKIGDKDSFLIDYYMPSTSGNLNRMVSSNGKTAYMHDGKWVGTKPKFDMKKASTDSGIREWEEKFSEEMFARFLTGQDGWKPVIEGWQKGKGGYTLKLEQKTVKAEGKEKPFYRFLATRSGDTKATIEVRVDAEKYLPVAIRVIRTNKDGSEEKMYWNSQWKAGGTFSEKDFPVPAVKS